MKKYILFLLTFFMMINIGYSQKDWRCYLDFETNPNCYEDTILIDTIANHHNIWQIGKPNKTIFQSAYSVPNAIVTKLDTVYPINDTSSFTIVHIAWQALNDFGTMWINAEYNINSDTLTDYGTVEFSPDNGSTWINLMTDTLYANHYFYHWTNAKPVFSGNSKGWKSFTIWITGHNHYFNIHYGDTTLWKFTFISDSNQTFKDGWMLDDIDINDWYEGIQEIQKDNLITISPNPVSTQLTVDIKDYSDRNSVQIFDALGQCVYNNQDFKDKTINTQQLQNGYYFLKYANSDSFAVKKFVVMH